MATAKKAVKKAVKKPAAKKAVAKKAAPAKKAAVKKVACLLYTSYIEGVAIQRPSQDCAHTSKWCRTESRSAHRAPANPSPPN